MYDAAVIGTGDATTEPDTSGCAMGYAHGEGYKQNELCELVSCADLIEENRVRFGHKFDISPSRTYDYHTKLLSAEQPEIVSVCTHPKVHFQIVIDCIETDSVQAVHCEKPMGHTLSDCHHMINVADQNDVQLTINHQRRFAGPVESVKELLDRGKIGDVTRVELFTWTLYDYATHLFDLCGYFLDEPRAEWVFAQLDYSEENIVFGAHNENQAIVQWKYNNGVDGLAVIGDDVDMIDCLVRIIGTDGTIEMGRPEIDPPERPTLRYRSTDTIGWKSVSCSEDCHGFSDQWPGYVDRAIDEVVDSFVTDRVPVLDAQNALHSMEIIFGAWESARQRRRIQSPFDIDNNPLEEMVTSGELSPTPNEN